MPNYVYNNMRIYGNKNELTKIRDAVAGHDSLAISFNSIIPQPADTSKWAEDIFIETKPKKNVAQIILDRMKNIVK